MPRRDLLFATALRSILRQDPDVIMVGEIRDEETADIGVRAAVTGHLVLSTLHTNDCVSAVYRLQNMGIPLYDRCCHHRGSGATTGKSALSSLQAEDKKPDSRQNGCCMRFQERKQRKSGRQLAVKSV